MVKNPPAVQGTWETWVQSLGQVYPLEEEIAIHSSILARKIPWTEDPGRLQSIGSHRIRHDRSDLACSHIFNEVKNLCN